MQGCPPAWIDENLCEHTCHGSKHFPFEYYLCLYTHPDRPCFPWHWHEDVELIYVDSGQASCLVGTQRFVLNEGEGMLLLPGVIHSYETAKEVWMPTFLFMPSMVAPEGSVIADQLVMPLLQIGAPYTPLRADVPWQADMLAIAHALRLLADQGSPTLELDIHTEVCRLWSLLYRHRDALDAHKVSGNSTLLQARLRQMIALIEQRFGDRLRLEDIARAASISQSEALRCFRVGVGMTPIEYLNLCRLNHARLRLASSELSVTAIAQEAGFASASYFDRLFQRRFGVNPTSLRKRLPVAD